MLVNLSLKWVPLQASNSWFIGFAIDTT
jgi:hypothetical protein